MVLRKHRDRYTIFHCYACFLGGDLKPFVPLLIERLLSILMNIKHTPRILLENAAITMGRIGKVSPSEVAVHLPVFLENWYVFISETIGWNSLLSGVNEERYTHNTSSNHS
jgi:hypothetical protein